MEISDIFGDALVYPFNNLKALVLYLILGIILGIAIAGTLGAVMAGALANNALAVIGSGIIGIIIAFVIGFIITGYELDIITFGIERNNDAPGIDIVNQFINGIKVFVVNIVYFIIPLIIAAILAVIFQHWLSVILTLVLFVVFGLAAFMGNCRLAKTHDLGYALDIGEAIGDISKVGIVQLILFLVIVFVIAFVLYFIGGVLSNWNSTVGGIFTGIIGVYITFFSSRAMGLLYSDV